MTKQRFRSLPLRDVPKQVDREGRVIYGVSAAQAVEALGHGMELDQKTIEQIVELGNKSKQGIKSRFTHPGLSSDGMGKHLGRMKNFRMEGDKAIADLHLAESASKAPDGDLAGYVMDLAEEDSAAFGMSVVIQAHQVWTLDDGTEVKAYDFWGDDDDNQSQRPDNALTERPVVRVDSLDAVDVVDEPAANRDGMFSRALWGTNLKAEQMFGAFDDVLGEAGMTPAQAWSYALRYFEARQVDLKGMAMDEAVMEPTEQETEVVDAVATDESADAQGDEVTQEEMQSLQQELAAFKQREQDALAQAAQLQETVATMQREARAKRHQELARGWQGETAAHLTILEALGEGSEAFSAYKTLMSALSEQIEAGALFEEVGGNSREPMGGTAVERINKMAAKRATETGISLADATKQVFQEHPELYDEYRADTSVKA